MAIIIKNVFLLLCFSIVYGYIVRPLLTRKSLSTLQMSSGDELEDFSNALVSCLSCRELVSLKLNTADKKSQSDIKTKVFKINLSDLKSISGRLIELKSTLHLQLAYAYKTNDQVKNYKIPDEANQVVVDIIHSGAIRKAIINSKSECVELAYSQSGNHKFKRTKVGSKTKPTTSIGTETANDEVVDSTDQTAVASDVVSTSHDLVKPRFVPLTAPFLKRLNLVLEDGTVRAKSSDKLKQIQNFVGIMDTLVKRCGDAGDSPLKIVDMGCGRGYLTFAVHDYFHSLGHNINTYGIEIRKGLVGETNGIAQELGSSFASLRFLEGSISSFDVGSLMHSSSSSLAEGGKERLVLVALHACDTATDDSLFKGIQAGADVIVASPCCQKQVRRQIDAKFRHGDKAQRQVKRHRDLADSTESDDESDDTVDLFSDRPSLSTNSDVLGDSADALAIATLLETGIYRSYLTEHVTDKIRELLLELAGYETSIIEFTSAEATAKNVMITAIRKQQPEEQDVKRKRTLITKLNSLVSSFGVTRHHLIELFLKPSPDALALVDDDLRFAYYKPTPAAPSQAKVGARVKKLTR